MLYNSSLHSLTEDNGTIIALFDSSIRADRAFDLTDDINNARNCEDLEKNLDVVNKEFADLEKDNDNLHHELFDLKKKLEKANDCLDEIYDVVEKYFKDYSKEEMVGVIKVLCLKVDPIQ